jgi:hypothetical protein
MQDPRSTDRDAGKSTGVARFGVHLRGPTPEWFGASPYALYQDDRRKRFVEGLLRLFL